MSGCGAPARPAWRSPSIRGAVASFGCISRTAAGYGVNAWLHYAPCSATQKQRGSCLNVSVPSFIHNLADRRVRTQGEAYLQYASTLAGIGIFPEQRLQEQTLGTPSSQGLESPGIPGRFTRGQGSSLVYAGNTRCKACPRREIYH